jgi:hypothetical protein
MQNSTCLFDKAARCRRLAAAITARDDPAIASLLALAADFEASAIERAVRETDAMPEHRCSGAQ